MKELFDNLLIPAITAVVALFWLLAYKHPRTYQAVSAPFVLIGFVVLIGSFGYAIAWGVMDTSFASYADFWDQFDHIEGIEEVTTAVNNQVGANGKAVFPFAIIAGCVLVVFVFLLWISRLVHMEKSGKDPFSDKKDDKAEPKELADPPET